jgi:hypothetical protein
MISISKAFGVDAQVIGRVEEGIGQTLRMKTKANSITYSF